MVIFLCSNVHMLQWSINIYVQCTYIHINAWQIRLECEKKCWNETQKAIEDTQSHTKRDTQMDKDGAIGIHADINKMCQHNIYSFRLLIQAHCLSDVHKYIATPAAYKMHRDICIYIHIKGREKKCTILLLYMCQRWKNSFNFDKFSSWSDMLAHGIRMKNSDFYLEMWQNPTPTTSILMNSIVYCGIYIPIQKWIYTFLCGMKLLDVGHVVMILLFIM